MVRLSIGCGVIFSIMVIIVYIVMVVLFSMLGVVMCGVLLDFLVKNMFMIICM